MAEQPQTKPAGATAKARRAAAPPTVAEEGAPPVERWLWFIFASSVVMVIGFFVPRAALRPTVAVAIALMVAGLLMLAVQSWRAR